MASSMGSTFLVGLGRMFYIADPSEFMHERLESCPKYVSNAIPYFILFIALEMLLSWLRKGKSLVQYNTQETIMSISLGIVQQAADVLLRGVSLYPYVYVYENFRFFDIPLTSSWASLFLFLGVDLGYYAMHRSAHVFHFMWIGHSVHHSGEYYNFATALRQGTTQALYSRFFYLPLALIGFPFTAYMGHNQLNTLYQFWIHTEAIDKMSVLEVLFNTPSHHRMHHRPPGNCNYAGVLIIWDRLFGTFVEEKERRDVYGLAKPLETFNPLLANVQHALRMMGINNHQQKETNSNYLLTQPTFSWRHFLSVFFTHRHYHRFVFLPWSIFSALIAPNAWSLCVPLSSPWKVRDKFGEASRHKPLRAVRIYTTVNFVMSLLLFLQVLLQHQDLAYSHLVVLLVIPIWSLVSIGMLNECNPYSLKVETRRVLLLTCWLVVYAGLKALAGWGYGHSSGGGKAIAVVKLFHQVVYLEAPFYLSDELLTAPLSLMYAGMVFLLWMATRRRIKDHYCIVWEPPPARFRVKMKTKKVE